MTNYANEFSEILPVLSSNKVIKDAMSVLIETEKFPGKVTEGGTRLDDFRLILKDLINGKFDLEEAIRRTENNLSSSNSIHKDNNRVFAENWAERLIRIQLSRFYNQAVIEELLAKGETQGNIPHSSAEDPTSACSQNLAGSNHDLKYLHDQLIDSYSNGNFSKELKIPNHPHCTHVVRPIQ